jgi:hypothetical protein
MVVNGMAFLLAAKQRRPGILPPRRIPIKWPLLAALYLLALWLAGLVLRPWQHILFPVEQKNSRALRCERRSYANPFNYIGIAGLLCGGVFAL